MDRIRSQESKIRASSILVSLLFYFILFLSFFFHFVGVEWNCSNFQHIFQYFRILLLNHTGRIDIEATKDQGSPVSSLQYYSSLLSLSLSLFNSKKNATAPKMPGRFGAILRRRLRTCMNKYSTVDEIVGHLCSTYPDYGRIKQQSLATAVRKAMASSSPSPLSKKRKHQNQLPHRQPSPPSRLTYRDESEEEEGLGTVNLSRKKTNKVSESEQRLQQMEVSHLRRRQQLNNQDTTSTDNDDDDSDEEDGALSTSADAIYEQKVEPEFDLMKSMLRANYSGSKIARQEEKVPQEKSIEVEVVSASKHKSKVDTINGGDIEGEVKVKGLGSASNESTVTVERDEGPLFRDLGGMREVLEGLKMEVIVPLYHPQLARMLGVKPMAGVLLHGPPGCGKTKLAHAIANETSVPFYEISATEVVSGVSGTELL